MQGITKRYDENIVLEDVNLFVRPGEIHALLGENGCRPVGGYRDR